MSLLENTEKSSLLKQMLNKVPEVTLYFWIIKILCTTVGETAADFLNFNLHLGLTNTTYVMGIILIGMLSVQFSLKKYIPGVYWMVVVLISIVGTLITDNMTDNFGIPLVTSAIIFAILLATTFLSWYWKEKSLSIHTIVTSRREIFYWLAILFTFALGTAVGDLVAEKFGVGYLLSALLFGVLICGITVAHLRLNLGAITAFWSAYILTRPLGASLGDFLSQPHASGGLAIGTVGTSIVFLGTILGLVLYLSATQKDKIPNS